MEDAEKQAFGANLVQAKHLACSFLEDKSNKGPRRSVLLVRVKLSAIVAHRAAFERRLCNRSAHLARVHAPFDDKGIVSRMPLKKENKQSCQPFT